MKTHKINTLINKRPSMMGLQFGSDKCVKIHIGMNHKLDICGQGNVDALVDEICKTEEGNETVRDKYIGKVQV